MQSHIGCICLAFFSTVHFHVFPQMACLKGCKVTLVTFVWLFPTVHVHVFLQIACLRGCKVTLVAFVLLLGNLRMQLWKLSKLTTNGTKKEKRRKMKNFQKILGWNTRLIPYRKIPVYRDFAKIPYRTVPEWNSSYRWGLLTIKPLWTTSSPVCTHFIFVLIKVGHVQSFHDGDFWNASPGQDSAI